MEIERRTPANTAIVLIDYVTGYANLINSQSIQENVTGAVALARTALGYGVPLVVSIGPEQDPRGRLYPEITRELACHPLVHRGGSFDAFDHDGFAAAVAATGAKHLVIAGLTTEGCILHSSMGALRRGYEVAVVMDATAGETRVTHETAVLRLTQLGVAPVTWLSLAAELQRTYDNADTVDVFRSVQSLSPVYAKNAETIRRVQELSARLPERNAQHV